MRTTTSETDIIKARQVNGPMFDWLTQMMISGTLVKRAEDQRGVHGETCRKRPHTNPAGGYLHGADDDSPYNVDGVRYCGRCHRVM